MNNSFKNGTSFGINIVVMQVSPAAGLSHTQYTSIHLSVCSTWFLLLTGNDKESAEREREREPETCATVHGAEQAATHS